MRLAANRASFFIQARLTQARLTQARLTQARLTQAQPGSRTVQ
ncbi:MAG: pentapeptide repeat-containing protein [Cyanobacteria bacterium J06648_16]